MDWRKSNTETHSLCIRIWACRRERGRWRERWKKESDFLKFHICHRILCSINILWCTILRIRDDWLQRKIGKSYAIKNTWCHWFQMLLFRLVCVFFLCLVFFGSLDFLFPAFILLYFLFASIHLIWKVNEITFVVRANKLCEFISMWFDSFTWKWYTFMFISSKYWNTRQTKQTKPEGFGFEIEPVLPFAFEMKCLKNKSAFDCALCNAHIVNMKNSVEQKVNTH